MALGSNTDPYQPAEGRYRLMPGVIAALTGSGTPFSILTKDTTGRRHPELIDAYAKLYQNGCYVTRSYATDLARRSSVLLRQHGLDRKRGHAANSRYTHRSRPAAPRPQRAKPLLRNRLSADLGRKPEDHRPAASALPWLRNDHPLNVHSNRPSDAAGP